MGWYTVKETVRTVNPTPLGSPGSLPGHPTNFIGYIMFIRNYQTPFYHTIIDNFYTDDELRLIWQELDFITPNLLPPKDTQSISPAMKKGVFLHDLYKNMEFSNIFKMSRKLFTAGISEARSQNPFLDYLKHKNADSTLINYYTNKAFYSHHQDDSIITAVTALWKEPRAFTGGDLRFPDYDYTSNLSNNSVIIFPGFTEHEVTKVEMDNQQVGYGRYSITQFMTIM